MTFEVRPGALMGVPFWFNACRNTSTKDTMVLHQFTDDNLNLDLQIHLSAWFLTAASVSAGLHFSPVFSVSSLHFVMTCMQLVQSFFFYTSPFCALCINYTILYCVVISHKHCAKHSIYCTAASLSASGKPSTCLMDKQRAHTRYKAGQPGVLDFTSPMPRQCADADDATTGWPILRSGAATVLLIAKSVSVLHMILCTALVNAGCSWDQSKS